MGIKNIPYMLFSHSQDIVTRDFKIKQKDFINQELVNYRRGILIFKELDYTIFLRRFHSNIGMKS